jgi:hypothetical protein
MKNTDHNFVFQYLLGFIGIGAILASIIVLIASIFTPLPIFNTVILLVLGVILLAQSMLYSKFLKLVTILSGLLKNLSNLSSPQDIDSSPYDYLLNSSTSPQQNIKRVVITDQTSAEDIERFKNEHPEFGNQMDSIVSNLKGMMMTPQKTPITDKDINTLKKELDIAIANENFEEAQKIKQEIQKRTT